MKKLGLIIMAFALVIGFTQCKKDKPTVIDNPVVLEGDTYPVTLTLTGNNNSRSDVNPNDGLDIAPVTFAVGDVIWVAYNGAHCGTLECETLSESTDQNGDYLGVFTGTITTTQDGDQPLYFYFLGNKEATVASGNSAYTVDLSDQSDGLPVISYAASKEDFPSSDNNYTVEHNWLMNQCALVKFKMENIYNMSANTNDNNTYALYKTIKPITIYGMDNQVTVNLSSNVFNWSQTNNGAVSLYRNDATNDSVRYAIVHNKSYGVTEGALEVDFDPANDPYGFYGTYKIQGNIPLNDYFQDAKIDLVWHSGAFSAAHATNPASLDIDGNEFGSSYYIVFSRGNLQYNNTQNKWRFAKHQYDFVGGGLLGSNNTYLGNVVLNEDDGTSPALSSNSSANRSDNEQINNSGYFGWIDLFGWGTGDNPMKCRQENSYYSDWHEWGDHSIANDGTANANGFWYTLGRDEWQYMIEHRCGGQSSAESRIGLAVVAGVKGMILLPDLFNTASMPSGCPTWEVAGTYTLVDNSWNMTFTAAQWKSMEERGAVFFPAAGYRGSTAFNLYCLDFDGGGPTGTGGRDQDHGAYWSSTKATAYTDASCYEMRFGNNMTNNHVNPGYYMAPDNGHSVRLAHRVSSGSKFFNKK